MTGRQRPLAACALPVRYLWAKPRQQGTTRACPPNHTDGISRLCTRVETGVHRLSPPTLGKDSLVHNPQPLLLLLGFLRTSHLNNNPLFHDYRVERQTL